MAFETGWRVYFHLREIQRQKIEAREKVSGLTRVYESWQYKEDFNLACTITFKPDSRKVTNGTLFCLEGFLCTFSFQRSIYGFMTLTDCHRQTHPTPPTLISSPTVWYFPLSHLALKRWLPDGVCVWIGCRFHSPVGSFMWISALHMGSTSLHLRLISYGCSK